MIPSRGVRRFRRIVHATILASVAIIGIAIFIGPPQARTRQADVSANDDASLLAGFRHVEVASVSDALEQLTGRKMYMSHRMRPIFPTKFAGFALTVLLKKETNHDPKALDGMLAAIDGGSANSVYVMVVEDGADIAGMGGLMGTAMSSRNFSGAVIDGGVRDVAYLQKISFSRLRAWHRAVHLGDALPLCRRQYSRRLRRCRCERMPTSSWPTPMASSSSRAHPQPPALKLAQEMDFKEHSMYATIEKLKSIQEAVKQFGRL